MRLTTWFSMLSKAQRFWLVGALLAMLAIVGVGLRLSAPGGRDHEAGLSTAMTIRQIAPKLSVTPKALARELELSLDVSKRKPLKSLGVSDEALRHAVDHIQSHHTTGLKYFVFAALTLGALVFLVRLGRPGETDIEDRKHWYPRAPYVLFLLTSVAVCGFLLGKSPNPMEGAVKVFKAAVGLYPDPWTKVLLLLFFIALAIIGNKILCGWACPFGALQELIYSLPILRRLKRRAKLPFAVANTIRATIFIVMLLFLFGILGGRKGFVIYHYVNPFNLFALDIESLTVGLTITVALTAALVVYRPFCQLICPFGLVSWLAEKVSFFRTRIDHEACTDCGACSKACPSEAAIGRVEGRSFPADCFSCARCLNVCPVDAIRYAGPGNRRDASQAETPKQ